MALYLNQNTDKFLEYKKSRIFVDKSMIINECNVNIGTTDKYMCVTRPRRFGKTLALSMLNAYYSKGCDSKELFKDLKISKDPSFDKHLNKHNVIWIDMASVYTKIDDKTQFVKTIKADILRDLKRCFPEVDLTDLLLSDAILEIHSQLKENFIFLIDEWDVIYREQDSNYKLCNEYTEFLEAYSNHLMYQHALI